MNFMNGLKNTNVYVVFIRIGAPIPSKGLTLPILSQNHADTGGQGIAMPRILGQSFPLPRHKHAIMVIGFSGSFLPLTYTLDC